MASGAARATAINCTTQCGRGALRHCPAAVNASNSTMATNRVRPNSTGQGGMKIGAIISATAVAKPTAQATRWPVRAAKYDGQNRRGAGDLETGAEVTMDRTIA